MKRRLSSAHACRLFAALAIACGTALAVAQPLKLAPTPDEVQDEVRESRAPRCENASVVVRRCIASQPDQAKPGDRFEKSRQRAKAAFDRRDRAAREHARDGADNDVSSSGAQRLAPVVVTGERPEAPLSIEETLRRALQPAQPAGATTTFWRPDGGRTECVARCVGPACCVTVSPQPNSARDVFSIGR